MSLVAQLGAIATTNALGHLLLDRAVKRRTQVSLTGFIALQGLAYLSFAATFGLNWVLLRDHPARVFLLAFSLNYLVTVNISRWLQRESFSATAMVSDALLLLGMAIFLGFPTTWP